MKKLFKVLLCVLLTLTVMSTIPTNNVTDVYAEDSDTIDVQFSVTYGQTAARKILSMVNSLRTGSDAWYWDSDDSTKVVCSDLDKLSYDYDLEKVAMQRAAEISLSFSHTRPNNESCFTAYSDYEYVYYSSGENIAAGYTTADSVFEGWEEADDNYDGQGHRRNMLSSWFNVMAVGHATYNGTQYWVMELAYSPNSTSSTTANNSSTKVTVEIDTDNVTKASASFDSSKYRLVLTETKTLSAPTVTVTAFGKSLKAVISSSSLTWSSSSTSVATVNSSGKVSTVAKGSTKITAKTPQGYKATCTVSVIDFSDKFDDVSSSKWYYNTIKETYLSGLMTGTDDTHFSPNDEMSRAMVVTVLYRMAGSPKVSSSSSFSDVKSGLWYTNAIIWATNLGIVSGYGNGKFGPEDNVTREQMAVMLRNYCMKYKNFNTSSSNTLTSFKDYKKVSSYAKTAVGWAVDKGIITGTETKKLNPKNNATRAECAKMLLIASKLKS